MSEEKAKDEVSALQNLIANLSPFDDEVRYRLLKTVVTFLDIKGVRLGGGGEVRLSDSVVPEQPNGMASGSYSSASGSTNQFSGHPDISPKDFLLDKEPRTDVERVACLAFYLTHYRSTPYFRTLDISALNTEAAQIKFSNAAYAVDNATRAGYLVVAQKGNKQIGALGERYVNALPDRDAASTVLSKIRSRRHKKSNKGEKNIEADQVAEAVES